MLSFAFKSKNTSDKAAAAKTPPAREYHDFLPYYAHYDGHTLSTKNGELLQTVMVSANLRGLDYEGGDEQSSSLRDAIRRAILNHVQSDRFAVWVHTIRKRRDVSYAAEYTNDFARYMHQSWRKHYNANTQYYNEIYITLVHEGESGAMGDKDNIRAAVSAKKYRGLRNHYLATAHQELDFVTGNLIETLRENYQTKRLGVVERFAEHDERLPQAPIYYSEPMEFLSYLFNLREDRVMLPEADISSALQSGQLIFGFNALETKTDDTKKRFGAMLSLKQYREVPPDTLDSLLQAPIEMIISQAFHFIPADKALKRFREQKEMFEISGDEFSIAATGISEMLASNHKLPVDFGQHQTSFMVLVDDYKQLDTEVNRLHETFTDLGLVAIREDIRLEEIFWSMFPANFAFLRRYDIINTPRIAGFAKLNRFSNGTSANNHWGTALTLLPTTVNSPYFFNFHRQDNGHTLWFDYDSFADPAGDISLYFLLTEAQKYNGKLYVFDTRQSTGLWCNKMGGRRYSEQGIINPLGLEFNPRNVGFLLAWFETIASEPLEEAERAELKSALEAAYKVNPAPDFSGFIATLSPPLAQKFSAWHGGGRYARLTGAQSDALDFSEAMHCFDLHAIAGDKAALVPVFAYLLHRIIATLNGQPTIIVLHEAWQLLDNPFFAPRIESLLDMLTQQNVMIIATTRNPAHANASAITPLLMSASATHIYVPDDVPINYTNSHQLNIAEKDHDMLLRMQRSKGEFLVKQGGETIGLRIRMNDMEDIAAIFSNDIKTLIAAGGKYASIPEGVT